MFYCTTMYQSCVLCAHVIGATVISVITLRWWQFKDTCIRIIVFVAFYCEQSVTKILNQHLENVTNKYHFQHQSSKFM